MNKRLISLLQYLIFLGGGVFLIWWQLRSMTPQETEACKKALQMANYWLVIPVVVISLLSHISRSMRWKLLMKPLDYHPKLSNVFASVMAGYLANAAVPRLGEVLKCTLLARYEKLHFDKLFGSILVERIFDMICYLVFIGITILIQVNAVGNYVRTKFAAMNTQAGVPWWAKLFIMIVLIISFFYFIKFLMRRYPGNKIFYKVNAFLKGVLEGFRTIQNLKERKLFLAHTVFIWSMYLLQIYIGFWSMESTSHLGIKPAFSVLSLATLAMIATPGGIGSFPLFVKETLLIYNIAAPAGIAFGWLLWTANTSFIIVCGLLALGMLPFINKKNNEINTSNTN